MIQTLLKRDVEGEKREGMNMTELESEIASAAEMAHKLNLSAKKRNGEAIVTNTEINIREQILNSATKIATNDRQALYGDQTELNQCIAQLHKWAFHHRPKRMHDGEFTQWLSNLGELGKIFKSPVNNSEPFSNLAAGIGIAAECAAKEDK